MTTTKKTIDFKILPQPDDISCGPTCLHSIYNYYNDPIKLNKVIKEVSGFQEGGTLAVFLALHALKRGYKATIFTYNLQLFDPSWFIQKNINLKDKLHLQMKYKKSRKLQIASKAYLDFLDIGGNLRFEDLTSSLLRKYLKRSVPILTGLSSTFLYNSKREVPDNCEENDIQGEPAGHFVVLCGYNKVDKTVLIADPYKPNPLSKSLQYPVKVDRAIGAILLGIVTYDANLLIIERR